MSRSPAEHERQPSPGQVAEVATITGEAGGRSRTRRTLARLMSFARAVADADPVEIESTARRLGESRTYLAPVAWAAGAIVLLIRGIKLLFLNWRLSLI